MKKVILMFAVATLFSCEKYDTKPESCNCGMVVSDNVHDYSVVIRNSCSENEKKFYLQEGDWMNAHPGSNYCITNVTSW
jgi:hypothetical protein